MIGSLRDLHEGTTPEARVPILRDVVGKRILQNILRNQPRISDQEMQLNEIIEGHLTREKV